MKFIIGLTDVEDDQCYRYDDYQPDDEVRYNLYKLAPELEQATIEWDINTEITAFKNALYSWEQTIRRPHLNMTSIGRRVNNLVPDEYDYTLSFNFVNLIPVDPGEFYSELVDADFSELSHGGFGNLSIDFLSSLEKISEYSYENTIAKAHYNDDLSKLIPAKEFTPLAIPSFRANFSLGADFKINKKMKFNYYEWLLKNKTQLANLGYDVNSPRLRTGELVIGKLIGDPWEQYEKLKKYSRICRVSFVN